MKKVARWYQKEAYKQIIESWRRGGEIPYANMCPGSGKSYLLAMLSEKSLELGYRVIQLVPKLEHVQQNYREMYNYTNRKNEIGICCNKLNKFQLHKNCVIATASSFLKRAHKSGAFHVLLIDENHNVPNDPKSGYRRIVRALQRQDPTMLIAGVSGTPYRMNQGAMHNSCVKGPALFTNEVYETPIPLMIEQGFLSHMESISGDVELDLEGVRITGGGDYDTSAMSVKFNAIAEDSVKDTKLKVDFYDIKTAIIFTSNVANAKLVVDLWGNNKEIRLLHGGINDSERKKIIQWLENGEGRRIVVNPNILTEGYDFPALDLVVLMRATQSLKLYKQMVTRAIRAAEGKECGYVLDFGGNIYRHGPIDNTRPPKVKKRKGDCPKKSCGLCNTLNLLSAKYCINPECKAMFIQTDETGNYSMRSQAQILAIKEQASITTHEVHSVQYESATSKGNGLLMIKVIYLDEEYDTIHHKFLCLNHTGTARTIAQAELLKMFKDPKDFYRLGEVGKSVNNVLPLLQNYPHFFKRVLAIKLKPTPGTKYKEVVGIKYEQ